MEKLLLHSCCGPCSTVCIERMKDKYNLTIFYYNPNIEPVEEYEKRKAYQKKVCDHYGIPYTDFDYDNGAWRKFVEGLENEKEGGARCTKCFYYRLKKTAAFAKEHHFDCFSTTLSVSPYKNSKTIFEVGKMLENEIGIQFLEENFKKQDGYLRSIELSKQLNLYRQHYCGCLYACRFNKKGEQFDTTI